MDVNLAGSRDGISERFVPDQDRGRLIEVEHVSRYQWAAAAAKSRTVLDAGCGAAYGSRMLGEGDARSVVGVDIALEVLQAVEPTMPDNVSLQAGDVRHLEFADGSFEVVVCFEVIEHFADPFPVLDELVRVLAPGGLLLVSSPNRGVYQAGNPHHFHEFKPDELKRELATRLDHVRLIRQDDYILSALLNDEAHELGGGAVVEGIAVHKLVAGSPGDEVYTIAMASSSPLPDLPQLATMTGTLEMREWLSVFDTQTRAINDKDTYIEEVEQRLGERDRLSSLLVGAEQRLADVPNLRAQIADLEVELTKARADTAVARREAQELDQALMYGRRMLRHVGPLLPVLRKVRRRLRR